MTTLAIDSLDAITFDAPPLNPTAYGLYAATEWPPNDGPDRFLNGVRIKGPNYGGEQAFGIWHGSWCGEPTPGQKKEGERPDWLDPFDAITVWAFDHCDPSEPSRAEVDARAAQILRLEEQVAVERQFATRLLADAAPTIPTKANIKEAVAYLEGEAAKTGVIAYFHVGAQWVAREMGLFIKSGTRWTSPLGNIWVVGGGYVEGLANHIVATSQPFGWRDAPTVRTALSPFENDYVAVAERSVNIGYEAVIAAVTIS